MKKGILSTLMISLILWGVWGCEKNSTESSNNTSAGTAVLRLYLTDAPAAVYDSVNITFSEVSAHLDSSWIILSDSLMKINLLDFSNGRTVILGSNNVPAGHYTQIRLKIENAYVVVEGQQHNLDVPSGSTSGLKFGPEFTLKQGATYEMVVDFDVNRSIVTTGPPFNPKGYKLKPFIRLTSMAITGSISGTLTNPDHLPVAYAIQNGDTITSSPPDTLNGFFRLSFLPEGTYTVSVRDTLDQSYEQSDVMVTTGNNTDLGSITLQ